MRQTTFECYVGSRPRIEGVFETLVVDGEGKESFVGVDPTTVTIMVKRPDGVTSEWVYNANPEVKRQSLGVYQLEIEADLEGFYYYRFFSTGSGKGAIEGLFKVVRSNFS